MPRFYSNGKLLITGEYLVLNGAKALALPTKFGQSLEVNTINEKQVVWKSYDADDTLWLDVVLSFEEIKSKANFEEENPIKHTLNEILHQAYLQNNSFLSENGFAVNTHLSFPRNWGLGTSSTVINNIAQWLNIDAFELLQKSFGGSGYDIACAQNNVPIIYQLVNEKPVVHTVDFNPEYQNSVYFLYLNKKQSSRDAIQNYMNKQQFLEQETTQISRITQELIETKDIYTVLDLLEQHEIILSDVLEIGTVQERLFPDFNGTIKSLGAWGGDFAMVISSENPTNYFLEKGYSTLLKYEEMIL
jgi:mevalonate kinase